MDFCFGDPQLFLSEEGTEQKREHKCRILSRTSLDEDS